MKRELTIKYDATMATCIFYDILCNIIKNSIKNTELSAGIHSYIFHINDWNMSLFLLDHKMEESILLWKCYKKLSGFSSENFFSNDQYIMFEHYAEILRHDYNIINIENYYVYTPSADY